MELGGRLRVQPGHFIANGFRLPTPPIHSEPLSSDYWLVIQAIPRRLGRVMGRNWGAKNEAKRSRSKLARQTVLDKISSSGRFPEWDYSAAIYVNCGLFPCLLAFRHAFQPNQSDKLSLVLVGNWPQIYVARGKEVGLKYKWVTDLDFHFLCGRVERRRIRCAHLRARVTSALARLRSRRPHLSLYIVME